MEAYSREKSKNIFVASRMKNVVERKAVIDVVHMLGHTPIFIEAEQMSSGADSKGLMDSMIQRADALIAIIDDHVGIPDPNLGSRPPLLYEISEFTNKVEKQGMPDAILAFARENFMGKPVSEVAYGQLSTALRGADKHHVATYRGYDDLASKTHLLIKEKWGQCTPEEVSPVHISISWKGSNEVGQLGTIADILYTKFKMNITHVSGTSINASANIVLTAVPWSGYTLPQVGRIESELKELMGYGKIKAIQGDGQGFDSKFYFELRVLDVPGVLNAMCKAITEAKVDIDDLRQRPAPLEYFRQSIIMMWLSPQDKDMSDPYPLYLRIESRLRNLVGVRSISSNHLQSSKIEL